jgi:hypothetical protein
MLMCPCAVDDFIVERIRINSNVERSCRSSAI